ncbi:anthranilate synthase component II [Mesobacillus harenae]|uniref:anthranilate synthase component II n=1 Tax=Mesobacillus harenae TaxID=2213203 RepID=UPI00158074FF|nr:aminodeoxychorismate/anthranilate synthase component II [Mesobacillus harenae]
MILIIDNYDSFTFNLYQYLGELGENPVVIRNDQISLGKLNQLQPEAVILSPGPGRPENAGICVELVKQFYKKVPILGICLGHQAIGYAFGAEIVRAKTIMHGKVSKLTHTGTGVFQYLPQSLDVMRYHSLVVEKMTLSSQFEVIAYALEDQEIMAMKHQQYPVLGLQFHPESVGTATGKQILSNFLSEIRKEQLKNENIS